ncbi:PepSY domain-containing protein [Hydrogenophaga taeniospiralis]|uniref:PepSY domain-containing protein n=1 Tax=Hydrogenophaga taeniospiralis TaxID=65656 RepID=UPI001CFA5453|nr:PepSY domain-containing protein [Hydrogenophaga taeniospiralis]UCU94120.1 PepSY domain-containing protein [Hydrogenophaga taeniospiralis]
MIRPAHALRAHHPLRSAVRALAAVVLSGGLVLPAGASDHRDHERALQAVQAGQVLPLRTVLERLEREHPGQVLEVELEQDHGVWIYEVKLLQAGGQRIKLKLDARTAALLSSKTRPAAPAGQRPWR